MLLALTISLSESTPDGASTVPPSRCRHIKMLQTVGGSNCRQICLRLRPEMLIKVGGLRGKRGRGWVEGGRGRELGPAEFRASCLNLPQQPEGRIVLVAGGALALASLGRSGRDAVPGSTWCEGGRGRSAGKGPLQGRAGVGEGTWAAEPGSSLSAWAGRRVGGIGGVDSHTVWRRTCWTPSGSQSGRRGWGSWGTGEGQRTAVACKGLLALSEVTETED